MDLLDIQVKILKSLAHPIRLKIVKKLAIESMCVCELNEDVEFSQSNLSQHLKILRDAGIVYCVKEGMRINYYISDERIIQVLESVEEIMVQQFKQVNSQLNTM